MSDVYPKYKVAAVQAAPVYMDLDASVEKACALIDEAAAAGAKVIAFPEAFLPGYPWFTWIGTPAYSTDLFIELYKRSVEIPSPAVSKISDACRKNRVYVCMPVNELDNATLYDTQLWFDCAGNLIGKHRKLKPVSGERYIYGYGDGSTMGVMETEFGKLGGLISQEHFMPMTLLAMKSQGEQVHVASWPGFRFKEDHLFASDTDLITNRYYSMITNTYTIMASQPYTKEMSEYLLKDAPGLTDPAPIGADSTYTCIINPHGTVMTRVPEDQEEGICYADIDLEKTILGNFLLDPVGHYSRGDVISVTFDTTPKPAVHTIGSPDQKEVPYDELHDFE